MTDWATAAVGGIGIVVSGIVGVAAPWVASRGARDLADRQAARTLLYEAERAVRDAMGCAGSLRNAWWRWQDSLGGEDLEWDEFLSRAGTRPFSLDPEANAFEKVVTQADVLQQQIAIMFGGGHAVTTTYTECMDALGRIVRAEQMIPGLIEDMLDTRPGLSATADEISAEESLNDFKECRRDISYGLERVDDANRRFLEAAHKAAGVRA